MARVLLHPKTVGKLGPGEWNDEQESSLFLRVRESGARTWIVRFGRGGRKVTLAPADERKGALDLAKARKAAEKKSHEIGAVGSAAFRAQIDTQRRKRRTKASTETLGAFAQRLIAESPIRESTRVGWKSILKASILPTLGKLKLEEIAKPDVTRALDTIKRRSVWACDSAHKLLMWLFTVAVQRDLIPLSPMAGLRRADFRVADGGRRKVVASKDQLRAIWSAAGESAYGSAVRLGMLTLARRGEIFGAELSEFDLEGVEVEIKGPSAITKRRVPVWNIPASRRKNAEGHVIPLSDDAVTIVKALREQAEARASRYLLPGDDGSLLPTSKAWERLLIEAGLTKAKAKKKAAKDGQGEERRREWKAHPLRFHDLRRAGRSIMETELEIPASVAEAVIGHLAPTLIRTYAPEGPGLAQRTSAVDKWAAHLAKLISERDGKILTGTFGKA